MSLSAHAGLSLNMSGHKLPPPCLGLQVVDGAQRGRAVSSPPRHSAAPFDPPPATSRKWEHRPEPAPSAARLRALADSDGVVCVLALDHRDAMHNAFARAGVADVSESLVLEVKSRIVDEIADPVSALLLDAAAVTRCRRPDLGLLVPLERQGHDPFAGGRLTRLAGDFTPTDASALGAQACKLLLYYRADHPATAGKQLDLAAEVCAACHREGLALAVEPLVYRLDGEQDDPFLRRFAELVVAAAGDIAWTGADLLKLQFPGDRTACERVSEAASPVPWTLLGGAEVDGDAFARQLRDACDGGASGFIAGRAIWAGVLGRDTRDQTVWLRDHARPLLEQLTDIAATHARRVP
jgi:sulfofructosephosphate aldolase